ncbi:Ig-like domain-containing protein [Fulvivirga ligni]|uniref:Ig-like domain-containing protein n=1 Tax=Fulvivirga ligni TaxID=2904246 RepID=UPI001F1AC8FC|nr:Ig-like domain-containing protein [Fulvivirga ligni]UII23856.1 Ig-like domain-containing protein [Fulvivirga ligni]
MFRVQFKTNVLLAVLCLFFRVAIGQIYDPGPGKTLSLIGQTYQSEYTDYISTTGITPAGSSHYASFYLGRIEQGDDDPNAQFLDYVRNNDLVEYALVALSIKDNTAAGGYGQMIDPGWPQFNANAIWEATEDIVNGQWNNQIDAFSNIMKSRGDTKFMLRIGYEVSLLLFANRSETYAPDVLNRYASQGINALENADQVTEWDLQSYKDAYNYIANRIRNVNGVTNVNFVYHPVRGYWDTYWLYPGDQYVDWFALSVFNNDVCLPFGNTANCAGDPADGNLLSSFDFARQRGKPLMIAESAANSPANQSPQGFNDYLSRVDNLIKSEDIRAWVYINSNWSEDKNGDGQPDWGPEWGDSRVQKFSSTLSYWQNLMSDPRYINLNQGGGGNSVPQVQWINPTPSEGANLAAGSSISVQISASDADGISNASLSINGNFVRQENLAPYEWGAQGQNDPLLQNLNAGNYTLSVIVTDNQGATTTISRSFAIGSNGGGGDCTSSSCPPSHQYFLCGQCWESPAQAESGGCAETCENTGGDNGGGSGDDCTSTSCPASHPYLLCGQCWESAAQAESGGCTETCNNGSGGGGSSNDLVLLWQSPTPSGSIAGGVNITASVGISAGQTSAVSLFVNGSLINQDAIAPYQWSLGNLNDGVYNLQATATGAQGEVSIYRTFTVGSNNSAKIEGKFTPQNGQTLLCIGQDLKGLAGYRYGDIMPPSYDYSLGAGQGGIPEPGAAVAYISFYLLTTPQIDNINYGATGMDNGGNFTGIDSDWGAGPLNAASTALGWDHSALVLAMSITENWEQNGLQGIANGQYEANISKLATFCNAFPNKKIFLRIGYEFDGRWNGTDLAGGLYPAGYHKTNEYKAAWRHIVNGLRSRGVSNVAFVWQSSTSPVDDVLDAYYDHGSNFAAARENLNDWYPGDDYVDWCGISWFIAPQEADNIFGFADVNGLPNQDDLADEMLNFARSHNKPVMIAEATPQGYDLEISQYDPTPSLVSRAATGWTYEGAKTLFTQGISAAQSQFAPGTWFENMSAQQAWNRWYVPFLDYIHQNEDVIRAATYINTDWNEQAKWTYPYYEGYWGDTRIEANAVIKQNWLSEIQSGFWLLGSPGINSNLNSLSVNAVARKSFSEEIEVLNVAIYPNPVNHTLNIRKEGTVKGVILDFSGREVMHFSGKEIDVSSLGKGTYFIKINQEIERFIKL